MKVIGITQSKMDQTYRWGMLWFIVSEIAFLGFFGALFYEKNFQYRHLGEKSREETHALLAISSSVAL